jgi:hypothetical protein
MEDRAATVAEHLLWEMESRESVDIIVTTSFRYEAARDDPRISPSAQTSERYIEDAAGRKMYEVVRDAPGEPPSLSVYSCDGARCADVVYAGGRGSPQLSVRIKKSFGNEDQFPFCFRPLPLRYLYVGQVPLQEALRKAVHLRTEPCLGRTCDVFLFRKSDLAGLPLDIVHWIDQTSSIPLKVVGYNTEAQREMDLPCWTWEAQSLDLMDGHYIPRKSAEHSFLVNDDGSRTTRTSSTITVEKIKYNAHHDDAIFWPDIQKTAFVYDSISKAVRVPEGRKPATEKTA